jgi:hypothetical protein
MSNKHWDDFCNELEEMIDAADDAWEAEQKGSINRRDSIRESRYEPSKIKMKAHLDLYIDARIKEFIRDHTDAKLVIYNNDLTIEDDIHD